MRVLCVDHEERSLNEAVAICRENPAVDAVVGLGSAAEVLEWFKMNRVDFALIDVELPDKSGIDLAAELREMSPLLPIVFLAEDARLAYEAFRVYPQNYLLKPRTRPRTRAWTRAQTWAPGFKTGTDHMILKR